MLLSRIHSRARQRGLTLVELLVVVTILAAVAGIAFTYQSSVQKRMANDLDKVQLAELVRALRRFHQDTGYYPRQGPFALTANGGAVSSADCTEAACSDFYSPANLRQLFEPPTYDAASTSSLAWLIKNAGVEPGPDEPRHWRGPYLQSAAAGALHVLVGSSLGADGTGDPAAGTLLSLVGQADPRPLSANACTASGSTSVAFCWYVTDTSGNLGAAVQRAAPYLFILGTGVPGSSNPPRVVGLGADGVYGGVNADSTRVCQPADRSDDLVVCL